MRESTIEAYLVRRVRETGGVAYKFTSPGRKNVPDRLVLYPGGFLRFIEVKATGEKPNEGQLREHRRLRKMGFPVYVFDSKSDVDALVTLRRM